jgi:type III pantothenate kinase
MSSNLVIDIGNHSTKVYVFSEGKIHRQKNIPGQDWSKIIAATESENFSASIVSSVVHIDPELTSVLRKKALCVVFDGTTSTPLKIKYTTAETLGPDRIAAALAGWQLSGGGNVLVIVAGTCITYNFVDESGSFLGGAISPGIHMRLQAMHEFTGKLPLVKMEGDRPLIGNSTETSIRSGALHGAILEVKGMIAEYSTIYSDLKIVVSGGDGSFLAEALKNGIFARPELVAEGLNTILNYNVANRLIR